VFTARYGLGPVVKHVSCWFRFSSVSAGECFTSGAFRSGKLEHFSDWIVTSLQFVFLFSAPDVFLWLYFMCAVISADSCVSVVSWTARVFWYSVRWKLNFTEMNFGLETVTKPCVINPLNTKRICFLLGVSPYRAVNTLNFGYKNQPLNAL
jgi:hypothetical protein